MIYEILNEKIISSKWTRVLKRQCSLRWSSTHHSVHASLSIRIILSRVLFVFLSLYHLLMQCFKNKKIEPRIIKSKKFQKEQQTANDNITAVFLPPTFVIWRLCSSSPHVSPSIRLRGYAPNHSR